MASAHGDECPKCRAPMRVPDEENVRRLQQLIRDREPGRHTSHAQCQLGSKYAYGEGVGQDLVEAVRLFKLVAEGGYATAQDNLGCCYRGGQGVEQNYVEARRWYTLAAQQGNSNAQCNLGTMHCNGQGGPVDYVEAVRWIKLSADQGNATARSSSLPTHSTASSHPAHTSSWWGCQHQGATGCEVRWMQHQTARSSTLVWARLRWCLKGDGAPRQCCLRTWSLCLPLKPKRSAERKRRRPSDKRQKNPGGGGGGWGGRWGGGGAAAVD
jgi:hypothetical protein